MFVTDAHCRSGWSNGKQNTTSAWSFCPVDSLALWTLLLKDRAAFAAKADLRQIVTGDCYPVGG